MGKGGGERDSDVDDGRGSSTALIAAVHVFPVAWDQEREREGIADGQMHAQFTRIGGTGKDHGKARADAPHPISTAIPCRL